MSDQGKRRQFDGDGLDSDAGVERTPGSVRLAVEAAGKANGWPATNVHYAAALTLATRMDDVGTSDSALAGLSAELRQQLKSLGGTLAESGTNGTVSELDQMAARFGRQRRSG